MVQPIQGRFKKMTINKGPITAKTRIIEEKASLNNSLTYPFRSLGSEELLFNLEEKPNNVLKLIDNDTKRMHIQMK